MTTVTIQKDHNQAYKGFTCIGHADYAKRNQPDILCAAISALVIGTVNSLEELAGEKMTVDTDEATGFIRCIFQNALQERSNFLVDAMVFNLENLSREYGKKYLQVKFEEV